MILRGWTGPEWRVFSRARILSFFGEENKEIREQIVALDENHWGSVRLIWTLTENMTKIEIQVKDWLTCKPKLGEKAHGAYCKGTFRQPTLGCGRKLASIFLLVNCCDLIWEQLLNVVKVFWNWLFVHHEYWIEIHEKLCLLF